MINSSLLKIVESVLGKGSPTSKGNYSFSCPFCNHHKKKLEINLILTEKSENQWACWICKDTNNTRGKSLVNLFKKLKTDDSKIRDLKTIIGESEKYVIQPRDNKISLPKEFKSLKQSGKSITYKHALKYLRSRRLTETDVSKYNIGYCEEGTYANRIIIPSYDKDGNLNYFSSRAFYDHEERKYKNPKIDITQIIGFELFINWSSPIILCEGIFDALTIKRNVIPLFGKTIGEALMKQLMASKVNKIYIALDKDAIKDSLKHVETLLDYGKEVYLVELEAKDANEIGSEEFLKTIELTKPINYGELIKRKITVMYE